ncbi:MAG: glycosyltransferase family 4 protein [Endomicrobia bacterium]|nr:glycosyltransferase family 4 protein [Endomicrobiia bacterium]
MQKKVLVLTPILPYPPDDGSRIRTYQTIKSLQGRYKIDLCSFYTKEDNIVEAKKFLMTLCDNIFFFPLPRINVLSQKLFVYTGNKLIKKEVNKIIKKGNYDLVHVEKVIMLYYVDKKINKKISVIIDSWGIDSLISYQKFIFEKNFVKKKLKFLKYLRHFVSELNLLKKADVLVAITQQQANFYKKYIKNKKILLIPNWVDTEYFCPCREVEKNSIVFTGIMDFYPNIDAVNFFCSEIIPCLKNKIDFKFYIVGKRPSKEILKFHNSKNIIVTGEVEDIRTYLNKAEIFVSPLRTGSGLRNKILEAMACGKPIVATSCSCEGLDVEDGKHLLIADTPEEFADKVLSLLTSESLKQYISENARKFVVENFSVDKIKNIWIESYEQIFNSGNNCQL